MARIAGRLVVVAVGVLIGWPSGAGGTDGGAGLDRLVAAAREENGLPSLSVAVAHRGEVVYSGASGLADLAHQVPATPRTVYPIGSVTKPITATTALLLAERGRLDLDAPVGRSCPAFPEREPAPTVRQLLAHLGGIRGYDYRRFEQDYLNRQAFDSTTAALARFADDPPIGAPGERFQYSSFGYVLVGCAIEGAGGAAWIEVVRREILEPLGMDDTRLDTVREVVPRRASGYGRRDDGSFSPAGCFDPSDRYPAGGLLSAPSDLVRFAGALLAGRLLEPASRAAMWTEQTTAGGEPTGAGLGWTVSADGEIFHGGTTVGGSSFLYLRPADQVAVALATNLSLWTSGREDLARQLADLALATASGSAERTPDEAAVSDDRP